MSKLRFYNYLNLVKIGTSNRISSRENGKIKVVNIISLICAILLLFSFYFDLSKSKMSYLTIDIFNFGFAITPLILNYFEKYRYAIISVVLVNLLMLLTSAVFIGYSSILGFCFIVPIILMYLFYENINSYLKTSILIFIFVFLAIKEYIQYSYSDFTHNIVHYDYVYDRFLFFGLFAAISLVMNYYSKNLYKTEKRLLLYKEIFRNSPNAISITDSKGFYYEQNSSHEKIIGFSNEELIGKTPAIHMGDDKFNEVADAIIKNGYFTGEIKSRCKTGLKDLDLLVFPIFDNRNKPIYFVGIKKDITDKKKIELLIQEKNKQLQKINEDKDKFISILAHDLKNPFHALLGFSSDLLENIRVYNENEIEDLIKCINIISGQTYHLLEDLLIWARTQAGKMIVERELVDLNSLCLEVIEGFDMQAKNKQISLLIESKEEVSLMADKNMLRTILRNLISNAIKFTNCKGEVVVCLRKESSNINVSVSDNGVGIDKSDLNKLLDLSSCVIKSGTFGEKGSGFGLQLCKEFIYNHNGTLKIESELGKGSCFTFTVPLINEINQS